MIINLNDHVRFILTSEGERVIRQYDAALTERLKSVTGTDFDWFKYHEPLDDKGTRKEQLWNLFQMFGASMYMAAPLVFVNNRIEHLEEDQEWPLIQPSPKSTQPTGSSSPSGSDS